MGKRQSGNTSLSYMWNLCFLNRRKKDGHKNIWFATNVYKDEQLSCLSGGKNVGKKIDREGKNLKLSCYFRLTVYRLEEDLN